MTDCVLTVFFEGTSNPLFDDDSNITTQLGLFFGLVRGVRGDGGRVEGIL